MENYLVSLIQTGNTITVVRNKGTFQYSGLVKGKVFFTDNYFSGYDIGISIQVAKEISILEYDSSTDEFILPYEFFALQGQKMISLFGKRGDETITSNVVTVVVESSLPTTIVTP